MYPFFITGLFEYILQVFLFMKISLVVIEAFRYWGHVEQLFYKVTDRPCYKIHVSESKRDSENDILFFQYSFFLNALRISVYFKFSYALPFIMTLSKSLNLYFSFSVYTLLNLNFSMFIYKVRNMEFIIL